MLRIDVRHPVRADVPELARHFIEMQAHYQDPVTEAAALEAAELACRPHGGADSFAPRTLVAVEPDGVVCGSIVLNVTFPAARLARSLYVRDLYVAAAVRRRGVARALLRAAARLTINEGFCALDWTTDSANDPARTMYEHAGAQTVARVYYRLAEDRLRRVAQ